MQKAIAKNWRGYRIRISFTETPKTTLQTELNKAETGQKKKRKKSLTETKSSAYNTRLTETGCSALS